MRQRAVNKGRDFDLLALRARRQQFDRRLDQLHEIERLLFEVELAGFDLGEIENFLDQGQQHVAGSLHRLDVALLLRRQGRVAQQAGHAEDAVQRRADFMRDHRQEAALGLIGGLRFFTRFRERALCAYARRDIAADALRLCVQAVVRPHRNFVPRYPART